jgi:UDP:flavonoid glycosyltransferase YjiC (YdhE family)
MTSASHPGSNRAPLVVFYVSGHGFGHGARSSHAMRELRRLAPRVRIQVRTSTPSWLFPDDVQVHPLQVDVGVLQRDSLTMLVDETIEAAAQFERARPALIVREAAQLAEDAPSVIVGDIPALTFDVAARLGLPSIAIGNFSWDWIYANLGSTRPEVAEIVGAISASEGKASQLLRLPFHDTMAAFPAIEDVPLLACVATADRRETRKRLGLPLERSVVLISYGGFGFDRLKPAHLGALPDVTFATTISMNGALPDNLVILPPHSLGYQDLLAACDAVMMKPGYGTVADCVANRVPMIYTPRGGFAEEALLVAEMEKVGPAVCLAQEDLNAGRIGSAIRRALTSTTPWAPIRLDGASVVARRILHVGGLLDWVEHRDAVASS